MVLAIIWILLSAWLSATGWILSALHELNGPGYLLALAATVAGGLAFKNHWWTDVGFPRPNWRKQWRRFHRPAPLMVLAIAVLCLASGLWAAPANGDSSC